MRIHLVCAAIVLVALAGCRGRDTGSTGDPIAKKAGAKVGETLVDFATGVGAGVDKKMLVPIELSPAVGAKGITHTAAKALGVGVPETSKGFTIYLIAQRPYEGPIIAKAFDKAGAEIGRSRVKVSFTADDAKYVAFEFDSRMDSNMVAKYVLDLPSR